MTDRVRLHESWRDKLAAQLDGPGMTDLRSFLVSEMKAGREIYPKPAEWFRALDLTPLDDVRVVILGQDPYHGQGQAHGLSFSVRPGVRIPPSLANIYKEIQSDLGFSPPPHGFLEHWARQGVLLLNNSLTVERSKPASHQGRGWEAFTDAVIRTVDAGPPSVFLLWGSHAQKKAESVDGRRHLVIKTSHPSPYSADRGFFGSRPFSRANAFLEKNGRGTIDWQIPASPDQP